MKKIILIALSLVSFANLSLAQLEEGNMIVDVNYGLLGGNKGLFFTFIESYDSAGQVKTSYVGPVAIRFQYMVSENFGIGFETNYNKRIAQWTESDFDYDLNRYTDQNYSLSQTIIRLMLRTSYEFVNEEKYQIMWANSIGYRTAIWTVEPNYDIGSYVGGWPLAFRTAIGTRYWLAENVGINAEIGLSGGSYINAGLSAKF